VTFILVTSGGSPIAALPTQVRCGLRRASWSRRAGSNRRPAAYSRPIGAVGPS